MVISRICVYSRMVEWKCILGMGSENETEVLFIVLIIFHRGTIDDCELVEGLVLTQKVANSGISRVEKAKIGLIQFCLSAPKTDVSKIQVGSCCNFLIRYVLKDKN